MNDEVPKFEADSLIANIEENCPYKTSLTIVGANTLTHVSDLDQENICQWYQSTYKYFILWLANKVFVQLFLCLKLISGQLVTSIHMWSKLFDLGVFSVVLRFVFSKISRALLLSDIFFEGGGALNRKIGVL